MSDVKESALTQQSDCKWVRALDANGNSIRISKEDLASVVGELARNLIFGKFGMKSNVNANDLIETGSYYLTTGITNARTWTFFEVIRISNSNVIQKELTADGLNYRIRTCFEGVWKEWKEITFKQEAEKPPI